MDATCRLWDVETGKTTREWKGDSGFRCVSLALGDKRLAALTDPWGDQPSTIHIFDTASSSDKPISKILMPSHTRTNRALWGPLNKTIITSNEAGALMAWDTSDGECTIERDDHAQSIPDFTFAQKDQMTLITGSADMSAMVSPSALKRVSLFPSLFVPSRQLDRAAVRRDDAGGDQDVQVRPSDQQRCHLSADGSRE